MKQPKNTILLNIHDLVVISAACEMIKKQVTFPEHKKELQRIIDKIDSLNPSIFSFYELSKINFHENNK